VSRWTYPALIITTQLLDALALVLAWGRGVEANPLMVAAIGAIGLGGIVALKSAVGAGVAAIAWRFDLRYQVGLTLVCIIGSVGALSALIAVPR
jgi:hypothetical protein